MKRMIGDFLVAFGGEDRQIAWRSSQPSAVILGSASGILHVSEPDDQWNGFPLNESEDESWHIWLLGELYEETALTPQVFDHPERLNGHFLLFGFAKVQKCWHVVTNRLGTLHAYYADHGGRTAFGSFSPAVARSAGCAELDLQAIAEFFRFGFFLGESTYWQGVRLFPPATHTVMNESGKIIAQTAYWQWHYEPSESLRYDDAVDQLHTVLRDALHSQVRGKRVALPLSGGLDSRSTLAEVGVAGLGGANRIFAYSYGFDEGSVETAIARKLGSKRGLEVHTWTIKPYLFDQIGKIVASVEGFQDITQCRQAYVLDNLARQADFVVAAHWGDVWLDDMGFRNQTLPEEGVIAEMMLQKFSRNGSEMLQTLLSATLPTDWREVMRSRLQQSLRTTATISDFDFKIKAWKTSHWSFRWTLSSLRMFQAGLFPLLPFYDNRMADFFLCVPSRFVAGRQLQIDYLKRFAPDLAKVKWQPYDVNLYHYQGFNTWLLPSRAAKKLWRTAFARHNIQRNWEAQFLNPQGQEGLRHYLLGSGLKLHGLIPARSLDLLLSQFFQQPTAQRGYAVSMLLTFSAWMEQYG